MKKENEQNHIFPFKFGNYVNRRNPCPSGGDGLEESEDQQDSNPEPAVLSGIPLGRILPLPSYSGHEMYDPVVEDSAEPGLWLLPRVSSCVSCRERSLITGAPAPPVPGILTTVVTLCWHQWVSPLPSSLHVLVLLLFFSLSTHSGHTTVALETKLSRLLSEPSLVLQW